MTSAEDEELRALVESLRIRISIIGCGGGGSNTVRRMFQGGVEGVKLVAANTDARHLLSIQSHHKVLMGRNMTKGLGSGSLPEIGQRAAEESENDLWKYVDGQNIVFIVAGMGGGTGTGAAPVVADLAKRAGALTIGVVTLPFRAEGTVRMANAIKGLERIKEKCDTTIVLQNDRLLELVPKLPLEAAFRVTDEVLMQSIRGITDALTKPGLVNIDFNDLLTIMRNGGMALIGLGESSEYGQRAEECIKEALSSPMLGDVDVKQAKGALVRVIGGDDLTVTEAEKSALLVSEAVDPRARIIWGCAVDPNIKGDMRVLVVLTGVMFKSIVDSVKGK
ncbi:MAG: cell division protein FtsZ [Methanomassiliicoccales archaeon]|nr:cell division protein FtsZ [Methanomassiliicoccales archaeon]